MSTYENLKLWCTKLSSSLSIISQDFLLMFSKRFSSCHSKLFVECMGGLEERNLLSHSHLIFQKDPVSTPENMEEKKYPGDVSIPSPKPKLHSRDLKKELITWVTKNATFSLCHGTDWLHCCSECWFGVDLQELSRETCVTAHCGQLVPCCGSAMG